MRPESLAIILIWTLPGLVGLVAALLSMRIAKGDATVANAAAADILVHHMARRAVRSEWGKITTQAIILVVGALSIALGVPGLAPGTPSGVLVRWAWVVAMELISVNLCALALYDLWARWEIERLIREDDTA